MSRLTSIAELRMRCLGHGYTSDGSIAEGEIRICHIQELRILNSESESGWRA